MTNREREVPPKSVGCFETELIGSSGQILTTVTAEAVERYEKPGIIGCDSNLSRTHIHRGLTSVHSLAFFIMVSGS